MSDTIRLLILFLVPALFGFAATFAATRGRTFLVRFGPPIVLGVLGAALLHWQWPILHAHIFTVDALERGVVGIFDLGWFIMLGSGSSFPILIGLLVGTLAVLICNRPRWKSWLAAVFLIVATFGAHWAATVEHTGMDETWTVYVYKLDDPRRTGWEQQSNAWVNFLGGNLSAGVGYESGSESMADFFTGDKVQRQMPAFVFVKQYKKSGADTDKVQFIVEGPQTESQLRDSLHKAMKLRRP